MGGWGATSRKARSTTKTATSPAAGFPDASVSVTVKPASEPGASTGTSSCTVTLSFRESSITSSACWLTMRRGSLESKRTEVAKSTGSAGEASGWAGLETTMVARQPPKHSSPTYGQLERLRPRGERGHEGAPAQAVAPHKQRAGVLERV